MSCSACFNDYLINCQDAITINAPLAPSTEYKWNIRDKFNNVYEGDFTTDVAGAWSINVADLPAGLINQHAGDYKLTVLDSSCSPVRLKLAQEYDCINFHVKGGTAVKDEIGCPME